MNHRTGVLLILTAAILFALALVNQGACAARGLPFTGGQRCGSYDLAAMLMLGITLIALKRLLGK